MDTQRFHTTKVGDIWFPSLVMIFVFRLKSVCVNIKHSRSNVTPQLFLINIDLLVRVFAADYLLSVICKNSENKCISKNVQVSNRFHSYLEYMCNLGKAGTKFSSIHTGNNAEELQMRNCFSHHSDSRNGFEEINYNQFRINIMQSHIW